MGDKRSQLFLVVLVVVLVVLDIYGVSVNVVLTSEKIDTNVFVTGVFVLFQTTNDTKRVGSN